VLARASSLPAIATPSPTSSKAGDDNDPFHMLPLSQLATDVHEMDAKQRGHHTAHPHVSQLDSHHGICWINDVISHVEW
jgi:hypothetical protein